MTSPATITPLSKASTSPMAAALFSAPLASCTAASSSLSSSPAPPGILQAVSFRLDSAVPASRSVFVCGDGNSALPRWSGGSERIRAPSSVRPALSCSLSTPTAFGGVNSRSSFGGSGSVFVGRRADMATTANASSASAPASANSLYDFTVKDIDGKDVSLSKYRGKVLLVVNVASACGLTTGNYTELAQVYSELKDSGLEILAFPCNQFGNQESGSNAQIKEFACTRYKAEYPIFDKIDVNGPNTAPIYQFLKSKKGGGILGNSIKWNFGKFLVDKQGNVVERYAPTTSPHKIKGDIKKFLGQ